MSNKKENESVVIFFSKENDKPKSVVVSGEEALFRALTKGVAGPPASQNGFTVNPVMVGSGKLEFRGMWDSGSSAAQKHSAF